MRKNLPDLPNPQEADIWQGRTRWSDVGPPLRPGPHDVALLQRLVAEAMAGRSRRDAILLGVTPEIATMTWPAGTRLIAIDSSPGMIDRVWPRDRLTIPAEARHGDWRDLPLAGASADIVLGDGCFSMLATEEDYRRMCLEVRRVLRPDGYFIIRLFVRPRRREDIAVIWENLLARRIGNFHEFKWRLAMALAVGKDDQVRVDDIWQAWRAAAIDARQLAAQLNWRLADIETIEDYRGSPLIFTFPPLAEVLRRCWPSYNLLSRIVPDYQMGERCPTLVLTPRRTS